MKHSMDKESRQINFPTENTGDTTLPAKSLEEIRTNMQRIAGDMFQNLHVSQEVVEIVSPALLNFAKIELEASIAMKSALENFRQWIESFSKTILQWEIPTISEERTKELISSYEKWGGYGWTLPPDAPIGCFYEPPANIEDANMAMRKLCSKSEIELLFEELRGQNIKKADLESAIVCYNNRQYKACALILFSIIDAKLIRKQKKVGKYRPSGIKAAIALRKQFENGDKEKTFFTVLYCMNVLACLDTFLANGGDFKVESSTINRNFLAHGMTRRSVRQRDCIQLFLALYNLEEFLKILK